MEELTLGTQVKIDHLGISGSVIGIWHSKSGTQYNVEWIDGQLRDQTRWCVRSELAIS